MASLQEEAKCVLRFDESRSLITVRGGNSLDYGRNLPSNNLINIKKVVDDKELKRIV